MRVTFCACGEAPVVSQQKPIESIVENDPVEQEEVKPTLKLKEEVSEEDVSEIETDVEETVEKQDSEEFEETTEDETESEESVDQSLIRPEFKAAMDEYEEFYDEYCDFMKKYTNSTDPMAAVNMLNDYTKMLEQMNEMDKKFDEWDSKDMTTAETAYYIDVTARIQKKLLEIANN